jgi:hypothetical protein
MVGGGGKAGLTSTFDGGFGSGTTAGMGACFCSPGGKTGSESACLGGTGWTGFGGGCIVPHP